MTVRARADGASGMMLRRCFPGACLSVFFLIVSWLFLHGNTHAYNTILWQLGLDPFSFPFLDAHGVLATAECHRYGIDVMAENPCDVLGRTLDYSPFWLITSKLGLNTGLTQYVGFTLDLLFLFWIFFLPPSRGWPETLALTFAMFSSMVGLALERANLDLAIFVIGIVAASWAMRSTLWRVLSYGLIMLAALVKYYPGVMLILAIRERLVLFCLLVAATLGVTGLFITYEGTELVRAFWKIESGTWFSGTFGAQRLPNGLMQLFSPLDPDASPLLPVALELVFTILVAGFAVVIASLEDLQEGLDRLPERTRVLLLIGCALIVASFFAAENAPYRGIYFLFVLPGITALWRAPISRTARHRFILTGACVLGLMWSAFLMRAVGETLDWLNVSPDLWAYVRFGLWLTREVVWWWVVTIFLALLICLVYRSETGRQILLLFFGPLRHPIRKVRQAAGCRGAQAAAEEQRI